MYAELILPEKGKALFAAQQLHGKLPLAAYVPSAACALQSRCLKHLE